MSRTISYRYKIIILFDCVLLSGSLNNINDSPEINLNTKLLKWLNNKILRIFLLTKMKLLIV